MTIQKHKSLPINQIHKPYAFEYADSTARLAATGFVEEDDGKLARQLSDNTLWMLADWETPTWVSFGGSGGGGGDSTPIGGYIFVQTDLTGSERPDPANYIELTAGLTGASEYNEGKLGSESITGSAPLVIATAEIIDAGSPMNGQTVHLLNTENRYLMPGESAGTVGTDQLQNLTGTVSGGQETLSGSGVFSNQAAVSGNRPSNGTATRRGLDFAFANASGARTGDHTNVKHKQATAFMRIK